MAIGTILWAVLKTSWMSAGVKSRIERTSRPRKLDIKSLIHRFDLKQSGHTGARERKSAADRPAAGLRLRISPPQLVDVRGEDHDPALGFHVPLPVFRVLLHLLRALHGDRRDDLPHDVVNVDAQDLPEQVLHPLTVHGEPDHPRPPYKRKSSTSPKLIISMEGSGPALTKLPSRRLTAARPRRLESPRRRGRGRFR